LAPWRCFITSLGRRPGITHTHKPALKAPPLGRIGQPEDIAGAAVFLASPSYAWITAETFVIGSGLR
ncbi:MAG: SDR family oxidoreductase, partial [Terrimicrobiaceae bacterium]